MNKFANQMREETTYSTTANGAFCYNTTGKALIDLFANIGGKRGKVSDAIALYHSARKENPELADNAILYTRNIRQGGLGERELGRALLLELVKLDPDKIRRNFDTIVETGRWDDLFIFIGTSVEKDMVAFVAAQLTNDMKNLRNNKPISIAPKWLPSINASSEKTKTMGRFFAKNLGLSPKEYRKMLAAFRIKLNIVERNLTFKNYDKIDFSAVPSLAMLKYKNAFKNRCGVLFDNYLELLKEGKAKINTSTLYPYDIVRKNVDDIRRGVVKIDEVDELAWRNLPNYLTGNYNVVFCSDISGSMYCCDYQPIASSVGLGIYFAERNTGDFHNLFCAFEGKPVYIDLSKCDTLADKMRKVLRYNSDMSTNLDGTLALIHETSVKCGEAPKAIIVCSDMEINPFGRYGYEKVNLIEKWKELFELEGLIMPKVIFWNVDSNENNCLAKCEDNVAYVSGYGASAFSNLTTLIEKSAYEAVIEILSKEQFQWK